MKTLSTLSTTIVRAHQARRAQSTTFKGRAAGRARGARCKADGDRLVISPPVHLGHLGLRCLRSLYSLNSTMPDRSCESRSAPSRPLGRDALLSPPAERSAKARSAFAGVPCSLRAFARNPYRSSRMGLGLTLRRTTACAATLSRGPLTVGGRSVVSCVTANRPLAVTRRRSSGSVFSRSPKLSVVESSFDLGLWLLSPEFDGGHLSSGSLSTLTGEEGVSCRVIRQRGSGSSADAVELRGQGCLPKLLLQRVSEAGSLCSVSADRRHVQQASLSSNQRGRKECRVVLFRQSALHEGWCRRSGVTVCVGRFWRSSNILLLPSRVLGGLPSRSLLAPTPLLQSARPTVQRAGERRPSNRGRTG